MGKRIFCGLGLGLLALSLCGCMKSQELKERSIIEALGIDKEGEQFSVCLQQFEPSPSQNGQEKAGQTKPALSQGRSIGEAIDRVTQYDGNQVFLGNSTYLLLGRSLAEEGLSQALHYCNSNRELSPATLLAVAEGSSRELLQGQDQREEGDSSSENSSSSIRGILLQGPDNGLLGRPTLMEVNQRLLEGSSPYLPLISQKEQEPPRISGMAVFREGRLQDVLPIDEAKGLLWGNNELEEALLTVEDPRLGTLSAQVQHCRCKIRAEIQDGLPSFHFKASCDVKIGEVLGLLTGEELSPQQRRLLQQLLQEQVRQLIQGAAERCFSQQGCDVFRFGERLRARYPLQWKLLEPQWEALMPQCPIGVQVNCRLSSNSQAYLE